MGWKKVENYWYIYIMQWLAMTSGETSLTRAWKPEFSPAYMTLLQSIPSASKKVFTVQNTSIPRVVKSKATTQQLILEI